MQIGRECTKCKTQKLASEFCVDKRTNKLRSCCKACDAKRRRLCWKVNPEKQKQTACKWRSKNRFKWSLIQSKNGARRCGHVGCIATEEKIEAMFTGFCYVCNVKENEKKLHMDHCHETGEFRGWLCSGCNRIIGFAKDSPERLEAAAEYLRNENIA
ncbi:hypothetical protein LCGC14_1226370 [marine sediment metagenome]|uniref:Recombination endonuclease VII n=1 Tax=marine sediment metagenome TaxID=412755 RepID=A0A0F9LDT3_9ZZZZ